MSTMLLKVVAHAHSRSTAVAEIEEMSPRSSGPQEGLTDITFPPRNLSLLKHDRLGKGRLDRVSHLDASNDLPGLFSFV